jgi:hypothetical protein
VPSTVLKYNLHPYTIILHPHHNSPKAKRITAT